MYNLFINYKILYKCIDIRSSWNHLYNIYIYIYIYIYILENPKLKKRLRWETLEISNKRTILQETAEKRNSHPTMENIRKFKKVQTNIVLSYDKEQSEYIQSKIDEIQNAVRNQKSAKAWKIVNEVRVRKNHADQK